MEKKLTKTEKILLVITAAAVIFTAGFGVGRISKPRSTIIYRSPTVEAADVAPENEAPIQPIIAEPSESSGDERVIPAAADEDEPELININTADAAALTQLPGIGDVLAERIIEYRQQYGAFNDISEITGVSGIGESKFSAIRELITVG